MTDKSTYVPHLDKPTGDGIDDDVDVRVSPWASPAPSRAEPADADDQNQEQHLHTTRNSRSNTDRQPGGYHNTEWAEKCAYVPHLDKPTGDGIDDGTDVRVSPWASPPSRAEPADADDHNQEQNLHTARNSRSNTDRQPGGCRCDCHTCPCTPGGPSPQVSTANSNSDHRPFTTQEKKNYYAGVLYSHEVEDKLTPSEFLLYYCKIDLNATPTLHVPLMVAYMDNRCKVHHFRLEKIDHPLLGQQRRVWRIDVGDGHPEKQPTFSSLKQIIQWKEIYGHVFKNGNCEKFNVNSG